MILNIELSEDLEKLFLRDAEAHGTSPEVLLTNYLADIYRMRYRSKVHPLQQTSQTALKSMKQCERAVRVVFLPLKFTTTFGQRLKQQATKFNE
jgi:hypothetical protein